MPLRLFGRGTPKLTRQTIVRLTEAGKQLVEQDLAQGRNYAILSTLEDRPHCSIGDIAEEKDMDIEEVKERILTMAKQGFIGLSGQIE